METLKLTNPKKIYGWIYYLTTDIWMEKIYNSNNWVESKNCFNPTQPISYTLLHLWQLHYCSWIVYGSLYLCSGRPYRTLYLTIVSPLSSKASGRETRLLNRPTIFYAPLYLKKKTSFAPLGSRHSCGNYKGLFDLIKITENK